MLWDSAKIRKFVEESNYQKHINNENATNEKIKKRFDWKTNKNIFLFFFDTIEKTNNKYFDPIKEVKKSNFN